MNQQNLHNYKSFQPSPINSPKLIGKLGIFPKSIQNKSKTEKIDYTVPNSVKNQENQRQEQQYFQYQSDISQLQTNKKLINPSKKEMNEKINSILNQSKQNEMNYNQQKFSTPSSHINQIAISLPNTSKNESNSFNFINRMNNISNKNNLNQNSIQEINQIKSNYIQHGNSTLSFDPFHVSLNENNYEQMKIPSILQMKNPSNFEETNTLFKNSSKRISEDKQQASKPIDEMKNISNEKEIKLPKSLKEINSKQKSSTSMNTPDIH